MNADLKEKLKLLPKTPGVYFHKNVAGEIIYVGKAAVLNNRVRQYFQKSRTRDAKTEALVAEIADTDWMEVESELEALFLEAEMVRRYMPRYNILLRDDKSLSYIRIDYDSDYPTVTITRRPLDDGAKYFGPYFNSLSVRQALKYLRRVFPFATSKSVGQKRANLHYHLGLDPGLEEGRTSINEYRSNLRGLISYIEGHKDNLIKSLERDMTKQAKNAQFEEAAKTRNRLYALKNLNKQVVFSDKEFMDISKDHALNELVDLLELDKFPRRIEGYDISHMSGTDVVASMVVFTNGVSDKDEYRKFKTRIDHNNDFYNMNETIARRLTVQGRALQSLQGQTLQSALGKSSHKSKNAWKLKLPDLVLIDGGKGQLEAAIKARDIAGQSDLKFIGLAKREEQIVIQKPKLKGQVEHPGSNVTVNQTTLKKLNGYVTETEDFILINLSHRTNLIKLLQRIRDESHRFAVSYHSTLKRGRQTASVLDDIPGFGPATRKKLLKTFGSIKMLGLADRAEIEKIIGIKKTELLLANLPEPKSK